jgi:fructose-bisphosphate aldolase, class I
MSKFIAALDHSGGSTGKALELYSQEYTEDNKFELMHAFRLRIVNNINFSQNEIDAVILFKDSIDRGIMDYLDVKGIDAYLKIDSGCEEDGTLKTFDYVAMSSYAKKYGCIGTKARSVVYTADMIAPILEQQFTIAEYIYSIGLIPIIEPEVPIYLDDKAELESALEHVLTIYLNKFKGKCILKLTIPDTPNLYYSLSQHKKVKKIVALSGGYSTVEACARLSLNQNMSASFSRAFMEGLHKFQTREEFSTVLKYNMEKICSASS